MSLSGRRWVVTPFNIQKLEMKILSRIQDYLNLIPQFRRFSNAMFQGDAAVFHVKCLCSSELVINVEKKSPDLKNPISVIHIYYGGIAEIGNRRIIMKLNI